MMPSDATALIPPSCDFTSVGDDGFSVVWLRGEHDAATAGPVAVVFARAIAERDHDLVVDLSEVCFMGSATVRILVDTCRTLLQQGRQMTLRAPSKAALHTLDACRLAHWSETAISKTSSAA